MFNTYLTDSETNDIDQQVAKVLRGLGNPEPPLCLDDVRELLELDLKFYSSDNDGYVRETISRIKVAGKQILRRPEILLDAIQKRDLKALWVPDRKRILIDETLPKLKWRWSEGHEIGHSIIPWHDDMMHGDDKRTLTPSAEQQLEAEANFAAGRLLFLGDKFQERLLSSPLNYASINSLATEFGNTKTTTLWRAVETLEVPAFGLVTQHPSQQIDPDKPLVRYFVGSKAFKEQFPGVTTQFLFAQLSPACRPGNGPIGQTDVLLTDSNGDQHVFCLEAFHNSYETLTLGTHQQSRKLAVAV